MVEGCVLPAEPRFRITDVNSRRLLEGLAVRPSIPGLHLSHFERCEWT